MKRSLKLIMAFPYKFKICPHCGAINESVRQHCISCMQNIETVPNADGVMNKAEEIVNELQQQTDKIILEV